MRLVISFASSSVAHHKTRLTDVGFYPRMIANYLHRFHWLKSHALAVDGNGLFHFSFLNIDGFFLLCQVCTKG